MANTGFNLNRYTNNGTAKIEPPPPNNPIMMPVKKAPKKPTNSK